MTLPTHRFRIPARVVDAFGSELELLAAINHATINQTIPPWNENSVDLEIPHDTWERFRNRRTNGMDLVKLRSVIMLLALDRVTRVSDGYQPGTLMIAQKVTKCPLCKQEVEPGDPMVNATVGGKTHAIHVRCANKEAIPYRATGKLKEGLAWRDRQVVKTWLDRARGRFSE